MVRGARMNRKEYYDIIDNKDKALQYCKSFLNNGMLSKEFQQQYNIMVGLAMQLFEIVSVKYNFVNSDLE